jgi:Sulfotransferase family
MMVDSMHDHLAFLKADAMIRTDRWRLHLYGLSDAAVSAPMDPVFVVGCPRSGTTLLFSLLARHDAFRSLSREGHVIWNAYQHPRRKGWSSDRATSGDIHPRERRYAYGAIRRITRGSRFLDKTPKNVLKIPYLAALFPNAQFLFLKRDGRATVSSLIEGWAARKGISYRLPRPLDLAEYKGHYWSYILPPGWRDVVHTSIADVAAAQYTASNETALADIKRLPRGSVIESSYEELVAKPTDECRRILRLLGLPMSSRVADMADNLDRHVAGALSPPRADKWHDQMDQIQRVLPQIAPTMARLGYGTEMS